MMDNNQDRLHELEALIDVNQPDFYVIGKALQEIRDRRLYRLQSLNRFDSYTRQRWDMGRCHAYRLINAAEVIDNLTPIGDILPQNESQARPLTSMDRLEQRQVWKAYLQTQQKCSALTIRQFITDHQPPQPCVTKIDQISSDYHQAVLALLDQIRIAQNDHWQSTAKASALRWQQVMKEQILWKK